MIRRQFAATLLLFTLVMPYAAFGQGPGAQQQPAPDPNDPIVRIKDEGMNRSQVMQTLSYLSDVIGPRLTASPGMKRANNWTRDTLEKWGMENAHLEAWGPFGRGWSLKRFSAQITDPQDIPLIAYPKAWSPATNGAITGEVVFLDAKTEADLEKYKGKLKGAIVLTLAPRELKARFEPLGRRQDEKALLALADSPAPGGGPNRGGGGGFRMTPEQRATAQFNVRKFWLKAVVPVMAERSLCSKRRCRSQSPKFHLVRARRDKKLRTTKTRRNICRRSSWRMNTTTESCACCRPAKK